MTDYPPMRGLCHVALWIDSEVFDATVAFYRGGLGLGLDWQPDADNVYLSSGPDNLALHRSPPDNEPEPARSSLDHIGFSIPSAEAVRAWYDRLHAEAEQWSIEITSAVKRHRDGATSFYLRDPAGNTVQMIHFGG